ncbi:MAG: hypothetical protein V4582_10790 [Pseudomonadota bacterium]
MRLSALLLCTLTCAVPAIAAAPAPAPGSFGFDWLKPAVAKCVPMTAAALKALRSCEYRKEGTFGLSDPAFACRANAHSEFLVYTSKAVCVNNLETMKANAP